MCYVIVKFELLYFEMRNNIDLNLNFVDEKMLVSSIKYIREILIHHIEINNLGLFWGDSGVCLFNLYYEKIFECRTLSSRQYSIICEMLSDYEEINENFILNCSEVGILTNLLLNEELLDENQIYCLQPEIESLFIDSFSKCMQSNNYSYFYGALNFGLYFLVAYKYSGLDKYRIALENFVSRLSDKLVIIDTKMAAWKSILSSKYKNELGYNFTYIHGINSIVLFLSKLFQLGVSKELCKDIIKKVCHFEISYFGVNKDYNTLFPIGVYQDQTPILGYISKNNLNIGDLMIGYTILKSGYAINNDYIICSGKKILKDVLLTKYESISNIGLFQGNLGLALICYEVYKLTGIQEYNQLYINYITTECGNLLKVNPQNLEISFMNGISGIGIHLMGILTSNTAITSLIF